MHNLNEVTNALRHGNYRIESWDFQDKEPADCKEWCRKWFSQMPSDFQLSKVNPKINSGNKIVYLIDFTRPLEAYWAVKGGKIETAQLAVKLLVD